MQVTVNGAAREIADGMLLTALVEDLGLVVGSVVVELNGTALLRSEVRSVTLGSGDVVELVRAVAGG